MTPLATRRLGSEQVSVIHQKMDSGRTNPPHSHTAEEVMVMLCGRIHVTAFDVTRELATGDTLIVPAGTLHSLYNDSDAPAEWLIVSPLGMQFMDKDENTLDPPWAR